MVARPARAQLLSPRRLARFKPEIAIFAAAVVLRLVLFLAVGAWDAARLEKSIFVGDARDYHRLGGEPGRARCLLEQAPATAHAQHVPGAALPVLPLDSSTVSSGRSLI